LPTDRKPLTWTIHLAARQPGRAVVALLVIAAGVAATWVLGATPPLMLLYALMLLAALAEFFLPMTYLIDERAAYARHLLGYRVIPLKEVRRVYLLAGGVKLSPLAGASWAEAFRGVLLRTPEPDVVLADLRQRFAALELTPELPEEEPC
jgi:hypothetical protein